MLLDSCSKEDVTGLLFVFVSQGLSLILKIVSFTSRENISITRDIMYLGKKKFFLWYMIIIEGKRRFFFLFFIERNNEER